MERNKTMHEFIPEAHCLTAGKVRPSNPEVDIAGKRQRPMSASLPPRNIRLDDVGHLPEFIKKDKLRCKYPISLGVYTPLVGWYHSFFV